MTEYRIRILETTDIHAYIEDYDYYTDQPKNQGLVYVKTAADQARQELTDLGFPEGSIVHLDAGDLIQGSPLGNFLVESAYTPGESFGTGIWSVEGAETTNRNPIYTSLDLLGVDASALGNHEFNFGLDYLYSSIANTGDVSVLSGNVFNDPNNTFGATPDEHSFEPYKLFDVQAYNPETGEIETLKIGVAGFVTEGIMGWDAKHLSGEVYTQKVSETAAELAEQMRAEGADLLFAITHTDHGDADDPALAQYEHDTSLGVAKVDTDGDGNPDYDALFGGHEHKRSDATPKSPLDDTTEPDTIIGYAEPFTDFSNGISSELNGVPFLMSGSWGDTLGVMDLFLTEDENGNWDVADYEIGFVDIKGENGPLFEADQELQHYIAPWHEGTIDYMNQPVAEISHSMTSYFAHGFDDPLLETFAEIQIDYGREVLSEMITNEGLTIDFNDLPILSVATGYKGGREGGTDYTEIAAPNMLNKDVASMYIYDNNVASIVVLTGAELEDYLEYSAFQAYNTIDPNSSEPQVLNKVPEFSRGYNVDFVKGENGALTYQIDVTQEPEIDENGATGNEGRIINLKYNGEFVQDDDAFFVVMNNYRSNGGGNYPIDWAKKDEDGLLYLSPDANQKVFADYFAAAEGVVDTGLPESGATFAPVIGNGESPVEVIYITSNNESTKNTYAPLVGATYLQDIDGDINGKTGFAEYSVELATAEIENPEPEMASSIRFMTFNSALSDRRTEEGQLIEILTESDYELAQNDAAIIQYLRPEVLVLQEFDYDAEGEGIALFQENYLGVAQEKDGFELEPIEYEYVYVPTTNTGELAPVDLNNDGVISLPNDGYGFGNFPGQYGMVLLSQYEIDVENIRTFQEFLWKDMPDGYLQTNEGAEGTIPLTEYYSEEAIEILRLSSKNHIDVPINVNGETIHVLASHPTPPVFDGEEKRNLKRNNDEIRFWADYIAGGDRDDYIYDDNGNFEGLEEGTKFVIMGDQNSDPFDGDADKGDPTQGRGAINQLLIEPSVYTDTTPFGAGGVEAAFLKKDTNPSAFNQQGNPGEDTSGFDLRVDYVLPSDNLEVTGLGVFNPDSQDPHNRQEFLPQGTFATENANGGFDYKTSDHRAVFVDVDLDDSDDGEQVFKVNLFHQSDQEGFAAAPGDANRNGAVMNRLRSLNDDPSLFINSGDLWIAGLYLDASEAVFGLKGSGQVMINNYLNWQTVTWGNHEFDIPTDEVANALTANSDLSIGLNNIFMPVTEEIETSAVGRTDNSFTVAVEEDGTTRTLRIHGSISDLSSPLFDVTDFSSINLVNGADDNAVIAPLEVNATEDQLSAYFTGVIALTEELQTALENGDLFVNVHTDNYQEGEVKSVLNLDRTYPGTYFPYISSNMDFAEDPYLGPLQVEGMRKAQGLGNKTTTDPLYIDAGGEIFAVVGATIPTMPTLASNSVANGGVVTPEDWVADEQGYDDLAALIQEQVDRAIAGADGEMGTEDDVNKVVVATHMQKINIDIDELVPRLRNVDVYIAGGSNTIFQNRDNPLYPGDDYQIESYPLLLQGADGLPTAVVNTDMNHEYLGYLQLEFNSDGVIVNDFNGDGKYNFGTDEDFNTEISRAYPGDISQVEALNAENLYDSRIDNLATALSGQMNDKESRWYGISEEFLNGQRLGGGLDGVRNQETNLSNLIHDSYLWYSRFWEEDVVLSMSNGSGIRASFGQILPDSTRTPNDANDAVGKPEGGISQADVESALAFNNGISLIDITGEELKTALESIDGLGSSDGDDGAYQIGGFAYSFDPNQSEGSRVRNARFLNEDGSLGDFIIQDGEVMTGDRVFRMATLGFNASRIFGFIENQNRVNLDPNDPQNETGGTVADKPDDLPNNAEVFRDGSQQDSLAEYLYQFSRMGTEDTADDVPLGTADTTREEDERIQILSYREDTLATDEPPQPEIPSVVFGSPDADGFDSAFPDDKLFVGQEQILFTGGGEDYVDVSEVGRRNRINTGSGDDIVFAGTRNRIILGAGDDILFAGSGQGANRISLGAGNDQLWLTEDDNVIPPNPNRVSDFNPDEDVIGFANTVLSLGNKGNLWDYEQVGNDIIISAFGQEIAQLFKTNITDANFVFA